MGDDREAMLQCLRALGVRIEHQSTHSGSEDRFTLHGLGHNGLVEPSTVLDASNSGTTMRLVSGLLAGQSFFSVITGDASLRSRPMGRIVKPLEQMGAQIMGRGEDSLAPLAIRGGVLHGIEYTMPVPSAQVKSCLLLAGLYAKGKTVLHQPAASRDHTERMLARMGASISVENLTLTLQPGISLSAIDVHVPSDISSAAYWMVAAACHPAAKITLLNVGINPMRSGIIEVLKAMNARITLSEHRSEGGEETANITVETSELKATEISGSLLPRVIDEVPVLALAACFARGKTVIRNAQDLRVKESDRISTTAHGLSLLGAKIDEYPDGMAISGIGSLRGCAVEDYNDHRLAMTMGIAGLLASDETTVNGSESVDISYPNFWDDLQVATGTTENA